MVSRPVGQFCPVNCFRLAGGEGHGLRCVYGVVERLGLGGVDEGHGVLCGVGLSVLDDPHQILDSLDGVVGEGVEDVRNGVEHQLHVRVVGTVVVDGEVNQCCGEGRNDVGMRRHDACLFGLTSGRGWLSVPPVVIGASGYCCRCVLRDVAIASCNGLPSWCGWLSVSHVAIGAAGFPIGAAGFRRRRVLRDVVV